MNWGTVALRVIWIILLFGAIGWVSQLVVKRKRRGGHWESISNPPEWVLAKIKLIVKKHGGYSSWAVGRAWYLNGRTYMYRITFEGQGGTFACVARKLRRGINK